MSHAFFMKTEISDFLQLPFEQMELSPECILNLKTMGLNNLKDAAALGWQGLRDLYGFNYIYFNELVRFLESRQLTYILQP
jgi:hypothetical protein